MRLFRSLLCAGGALIALGLSPALQAQVKVDGLTLWFPFERDSGDTVVDASGNGNDGLRVGGKYDSGVHGKGLAIGPADEYVEIPGTVLTPACTIMFWFKPNWAGDDPSTYRLFDANTAAIYFMISKGKTPGDRDQTFGFYFEDAADADFQDWEPLAADVVTANEWMHLAATWDFESSKEAHFYINGEEVGLGGAGLWRLPAAERAPQDRLQRRDQLHARRARSRRNV